VERGAEEGDENGLAVREVIGLPIVPKGDLVRREA